MNNKIINPKSKFLILLLSALTIIYITSCSKTKNPLGTPENPYTIVWYQFGDPQKDLPMVQAKANEYLRNKIGAVLDIKMLPIGNYDQQMNIIEISGQPYDLCFTASWTNSYERNAMRGAFYPLNSLLDKYGQGIKKVINPAFLKGAEINGELYAIPTNKELGLQIRYIFNENMLKKNGFSLSDFKPNAGIDTLKSLLPYLAAVKKNDPGIIPYGIDQTYTFVTDKYSFITGNVFFPGAVVNKNCDYKVVNQIDSPTYIEYYKLLHKMYKLGYIESDVAQIANTGSLMLSGQTAVIFGQYQPCADAFWTNEYGFPVVSLPKFPPIVTNQMTEGAMIAISINAKRPDIDMKFLNLLNTDKYLRNLLQYGIEGRQYKMIGPDRIEFLPGHQNYNMFTFTLGNLFLTYLLPGDAADKWEQFEKFNNSSSLSPILGFHFDQTPVTAQVAAVENVVQQYQEGLFTGAMDYKTYLPQFMQALKDAGVDKILSEEQKQLDAWVKLNKQEKNVNTKKGE